MVLLPLNHQIQAPEPTQAQQHIIKKAVNVIRRKGLAEFRLGALAKSATAPLYHFGTVEGLVGAVAEYGFNVLAKSLQNARSSSLDDPIERLNSLAQAHAKYGLENPQLYQAMHSASVWGRSKRSAKSSRDKAGQWISRANKARDRAFDEYLTAVKGEADSISHFVSVLVDGFLFQVREERVLEEKDTSEKLGYLKGLIEIAIDGLRARVGSHRTPA
jgi:AcrR family transcriptional regulator